jgi:hypothetical protein
MPPSPVDLALNSQDFFFPPVLHSQDYANVEAYSKQFD